MALIEIITVYFGFFMSSNGRVKRNFAAIKY